MLLRLAGESGWLVAGQVLSALGAVVGIRLLTSVLPSEDYGRLALGMTCAAVASQLFLAPIVGGAARLYPAAIEIGGGRYFLKAVWSLTLQGSGVISAVGLLVAGGLAASGRFNWSALILIAVTYAIFSGGSNIIDSLQNARRNRRVVAIHQALGSWGRFLVAALLATTFSATGTVAFIGYLIASVCVLISQWMCLRMRISATHEYRVEQSEVLWRQQLLGYCWPFAVWGIFSWLQVSSDRWALQIFAGPREVGLYSALYQLGYYPVAAMNGLASQFLTPILFQRAGNASNKERMSHALLLNQNLTWSILAVSFIATAGAALFHREIFGIAVAPEYRSVSALLPWLVAAAGLFSAGQSCATMVLSGLDARRLLVPIIGTAVLGLAVNIAGAWWKGITGVAIAGCVFAGVYFICMYFVSRKYLEKRRQVVS